jgi:hypothetical protein
MPNVPSDLVRGQKLSRPDVNATWACIRWLMDEWRAFRDPIRYAKTPGGGIAAGNNSANCTQAGRNPSTGVMLDGTATLKVWNLPGSTQAVSGSTYIVVGRINGQWVALAEAC